MAMQSKGNLVLPWSEKILPLHRLLSATEQEVGN